MKNKLITLLFIVISFHLDASRAGNIGSGGGGDSDVLEFLRIADKIHEWISKVKNKTQAELESKKVQHQDLFNEKQNESLSEINPDTFKSKINLIRQSVNEKFKTNNLEDSTESIDSNHDNESRKSTHSSVDSVNKVRLEFISSEKILCYGVEKAACTSPEGYIQVSSQWNDYSPAKKCEVVFLEMLLMIDIDTNRYDKASDLIYKNEKEIGCTDAVFSKLKTQLSKQKQTIEKELSSSFKEFAVEISDLDSITSESFQQSVQKKSLSSLMFSFMRPQTYSFKNQYRNSFGLEKAQFFTVPIINKDWLSKANRIISQFQQQIQQNQLMSLYLELNRYVQDSNNKSLSEKEFQDFLLLVKNYIKNINKFNQLGGKTENFYGDQNLYQFYQTHRDFIENTNLALYQFKIIHFNDPRVMAFNSQAIDSIFTNNTDYFFMNLEKLGTLMEESHSP